MQRYRIVFEFDTAEEFTAIAEQLFQDSKAILEVTENLSIQNLTGTLTAIPEAA
jgi:hypothetical protein